MRRAQPWRTNRARVLRSNATSAEARLWHVLRGRRLAGVKFVRQLPIGPFITDFACRELRIIVEPGAAPHPDPLPACGEREWSRATAPRRSVRAFPLPVLTGRGLG